MNPRKTARIVGVLFIIATAAPLLSVAFVPIIFGPASLANVWLLAANENQIRIGALLEFAMAVAVAAIPICMYPILKKQNESMALGYVVGRLVEGVMFTIGVISLLALLTLSKEFALAGAPSVAYYQTIGTTILAIRLAESVFAQFSFSLGSLMFYYLLYKSKLVPRWLSGWSLIGAVLFLASAFLAMFGYGSESTIYLLMNAPGGVGEMVFAVWLIVKGFNSTAIPSLNAKTDTN
jgi:hypothetical protein